MTSLLLKTTDLTATDPSPVFVESLRRGFGRLENVSVLRTDPQSPEFASTVGSEVYDSVVDLVDLQRAEEPDKVVGRLVSALRPGGKLFVQVPGDPSLYSDLDRSLGHKRRFTPTELTNLLTAAGLEPVFVRDFNRVGHRLWRLVGGPDRSSIRTWEARLTDFAIPVLSILERSMPGPGLSLVAVARKPD